MGSTDLYVQFGAGNEAIDGWLNFDASPTLLVQKTPVLGRIIRSKLNCIFDDDIRYGDIVRGLSLPRQSAKGVFCSHVLEHLSYQDAHTALHNVSVLLKPGGVFRIIVPDLRTYIDEYNAATASSSLENSHLAAIEFCKATGLGRSESRRSLVRRFYEAFRSRHYWMWDHESLKHAITAAGFVDVVPFRRGECDDEMFLRPEREHQFRRAIALQARTPA